MGLVEHLAGATHELVARDSPSRPPAYKAVGIVLAVCSGLFIGTSFVLKKVGLLKANTKYNEEAGEGYGYLKNAYWWGGMTLMIIGEICNFVAYAFVDAILVTPLGALSVVITTILSAIFLKERLSFVGQAGCFLCIVGSIVILLNAPEQSAVADIQEMQSYVISPGFLSYAGVIVVGCVCVIFFVAPKYGKQSMLVYLTICSLIGGLSVVCTQGLGSAIVAQVGGKPQFNQWFLYLLLVVVVITLLTEIIYLNKALNLYNAALVTPTYYVYFTSATIVTSAILFRGFHGTVVSITTMILGFLVICTGVVLLQLSKSAKDVPDAAVFSGDLDQVRTVAEQEQPESEPKADAIRGTAAIIRRISQLRKRMEEDEARRIYEDKMKDQLEPIAENEQVQWDGLRRRKTMIGPEGAGGLRRQKTVHPPLGLSKFPDYSEEQSEEHRSSGHGAFGFGFRRRTLSHGKERPGGGQAARAAAHAAANQGPQDAAPHHRHDAEDAYDGSDERRLAVQPEGAMELTHVYGLPAELRAHAESTSSRGSLPAGGGTIRWAGEAEEGHGHEHEHGAHSKTSLPLPHTARRTFSFQNVFHRHSKGGGEQTEEYTPVRPSSPRSGSRAGHGHLAPKLKDVTEEERLGLVKGDSRTLTPQDSPSEDDEQLGAEQKRIELLGTTTTTTTTATTTGGPTAEPRAASGHGGQQAASGGGRWRRPESTTDYGLPRGPGGDGSFL